MVRDIVGFFEREVPAMVHNVIAVTGALAMGFIHDVDAGLIAAIYDYLEGLNQVPTVVNNLARLEDARARLADSG